MDKIPTIEEAPKKSRNQGFNFVDNPKRYISLNQLIHEHITKHTLNEGDHAHQGERYEPQEEI